MSANDDYARRIEAYIPDARAEVTGGGGKFEATVISPAFEGEGMLARHRRVNAALADQLSSGEVHALSIRAHTPAERGE